MADGGEGSAILRAEGVFGGVVGNNLALALNAPLKLFPHIDAILIRYGTTRKNHDGKQTEKKCHVSHPDIIKKRSRMATLIPSKELLDLYGTGWFPMGMEDGSIRCFSPDPRGILPLDAFRVPHGSKKLLRDPGWELRVDTQFEEVIRSCGRREETWINETIVQSYLALHRAGQAHSLEVWRAGQLTGGLYGVRIGGAFFGESMFSLEPGASKLALIGLVDRLRTAGFLLLDIQWTTPHLEKFGACAISRQQYLVRLREAMAASVRWNGN
jgi:leucyl/phenylalanyl-tRNA---protein transferase